MPPPGGGDTSFRITIRTSYPPNTLLHQDRGSAASCGTTPMIPVPTCSLVKPKELPPPGPARLLCGLVWAFHLRLRSYPAWLRRGRLGRSWRVWRGLVPAGGFYLRYTLRKGGDDAP